ncbi:hypothetical protein AB205_0186070 [Aquarana catesbeiana]|uniref:Ig-like domain-containing protein n=1 Tax=Aquarana catesbeiana TaxID=8400 RepID=A0A2G9QBF3_AQUCT|nr:hypothetical protein AB205_0186070 [Aquarana catesbeiana]
MVEPIKITMGDSGYVHFTLNLQKFYPKDIDIEWIYDKKHRITSESKVTEQGDLTYDITNVANTSISSFTDPQFKVFVTWDHESLDEPETRTLTIRDLPWIPQVEEIIVPKLEEKKKASLTCNISGYFPDHLKVSWFKKEPGTDSHPIKTPLPNDYYKVIEAKDQKEKLSCQSCLKFTYTSKRDHGAEFICRVDHPILEHPIERSTGPIGLGKLSMNRTRNT